MKKFVIVSDSCCDLPENIRKEFDVEYIPMRIHFNEKEYPADLDWKDISFYDFYNLMREGVRIKTSQINSNEYFETFEKYILDGCDVLSISCASSLSSSYNGSLVARDELLKKYPDAKIVCIDSRNACFGLGTIVLTASKLRAEGKTIEEVQDFIETHKQEVNQLCTVESLTYLKRAGRVSAMSAVFGGLLQVKPIIISDINGLNHAIEKVKGRKNSINRLIEMFKETYNENAPYQKITVVHADVEEDAKMIKELLIPCVKEGTEIAIEKIGPIIGASTGPGTVAIYCYGKEVTVDGSKK